MGLKFKLKFYYIHIYIGLLTCSVSQGTYVLQDNKFSLLTQLSSGKQYLDQAPKVSIHSSLTWAQINDLRSIDFY